MPLKQTRGPQIGVCNICGTNGPLTVDHTPPKGWAPHVPMRVSEVMAPLREGTRHQYKKVSNGVQFRSLCQRCNRDLLGSLYDPELIRMVQSVSTLAKTSLHIPAIQFLRIKPQRLIRSIAGHLCAQGVDRYEKGELTIPLRDYIIDADKPFPERLSLCYWFFPYPGVVLTRDYHITHLGSKQASLLWIMKCFPLGFALIDRDYSFDGIPAQFTLDRHRSLGIDDEAEIPVDLLQHPPRYFPEHPSNNSIIMSGPESTLASASPPRGRVLTPRRR